MGVSFAATSAATAGFIPDESSDPTEMERRFQKELSQNALLVIRGGIPGLNRQICWYELQVEGEAKQRTVEHLWRFVQDKLRFFVPLVRDAQSLTALLTTRKYFVINEWTVNEAGIRAPRFVLCAARDPRFGDGDVNAKVDSFFSGDLIELPSKCDMGHIFEFPNIQCWSTRQDSSMCPVGEIRHSLNSPSGIIEVDKEILEEIQQRRARLDVTEQTFGGVQQAMGMHISRTRRTVEGVSSAVGGAYAGYRMAAKISKRPLVQAAGGVVGLIVGGIAGGRCLVFTRIWERLRKKYYNTEAWEAEARRVFVECMMSVFTPGGHPTRESVDANYRELVASLVNQEQFTSAAKVTLQTCANSAHGDALLRVRNAT